MMYINTQTLKTYASHSDVRADFPLVSLPSSFTDEMLASIGVQPVEQATPGHNPITQSATELSPALIGGKWVQQWEVVDLTPEQIAEKRFASDQARYTKRAAAKGSLLAFMAADNMSRVRTGVWTVPELMSLMDDPAVSAANAYMSTLSFELAAQAIAAAATPLLTPEIRANWIAKLQAHFYLEG